MKQGSTLLLIFVMLIMISVGYAAEIVERETLKPVPGDLTLVKNPMIDFSGNKCALIKISTDLAPFDKIESNLTPVEVQNRPGEVWLYLSPGDRRLYFSKDGYARLVYDIPLNLESNKVYEMKLIGSGVNVSKAFPVTIRINPEDAILKVENIQYDASKPVLLEPGTFNVEVSKTGFISESRKIIVSADKVFFEVQLKPQEPVLLTVRSNPMDADVILDNVNEGKTDLQIFRFPGDYNLRLSKTGFETIETKISVKANSENSFTYSMQKSTLTLTINTIPADAKILINNAEVQGKVFERAPGQYKIEVRRDGYDPVEKRIELQKGKDHTEQISLTAQNGRLAFTVKPIDADISLSDGSKWKGAKMQSLPVGNYTIKASMTGYKEQQQSFRIEKDKDTSISINLESLSTSANTVATSNVPSVTSNTAISVAPEMILVEGGSFMMGSSDGGDAEKPVHKVTIPSFMIGKYEVTQKEWQEIIGSNPSYYKGDNLPVETISWYAALVYCNKRSIKEGLTPVYSISGSTDPKKWGNLPTKKKNNWDQVICNWDANGYRLPTEAEWEYAARGGNKSNGYEYGGTNDINQAAWFISNSSSKTHSVGSKAANELGIHDMSGNAEEWCWDWYDSGFYAKSPEISPKGAVSGTFRVLRGGGIYGSATDCRIAIRSRYYPYYSDSVYSLRVVRAVK